jgi:hypothetical protein
MASSSINYTFGFLKDSKVEVVFDNLSFGVVIKDGDVEVHSQSFPPENVSYISSDQYILDSGFFDNLEVNKTYSLELWVKNAGDSFNIFVEISAPIPPQPFPSWTYLEEINSWDPPKELPQDGIVYDWNEENLSWEPVSNITSISLD